MFSATRSRFIILCIALLLASAAIHYRILVQLLAEGPLNDLKGIPIPATATKWKGKPTDNIKTTQHFPQDTNSLYSNIRPLVTTAKEPTNQGQQSAAIEKSQYTTKQISFVAPKSYGVRVSLPITPVMEHSTQHTTNIGSVQTDGVRVSRKIRKHTHHVEPMEETPAQAAVCIKASQHTTRDDVCGGCRFTVGGTRPYQTCGYLADSLAKLRQISFLDAVRIEVEEGGNSKCSRCLPENCTEDAKLYWRFDDAAPAILSARSYYLSSIPDRWRVPPQVYDKMIGREAQQESILSFFSNTDNVYPARRYLFEYNPSLVTLPTYQIPFIYGEKPVYLASYRVSSQQSCFPANATLAMIGGSWESRPRQIDYLGLALLRSDLSVIRDVVVNIPMHLGPREDFRLFVLHGQVYITTNCAMLPLWLTKQRSLEGKVLVRNMFPSKIRVTVGSSRTMCSTYWRDTDKAKNLNYFVDNANNTMVEMYPIPHVLYKTDPAGQTGPPSPENATRDDHIPEPSFYTQEELDMDYKHNFYESPFTYSRGGACCVSFTDPRPPSDSQPANRELRLGVSHTKTPHGRAKLEGITKSNQYVTRFYAFEATAPYSVVAMSGHFCLPANPNEQILFGGHNNKNNVNPHEKIYQWNNLTITGTDYRCPVISFVSGMVEKVDDPSKIIIAYGVNDCTSWMIEVAKAEVIDLLFRAPRIVKKKPILQSAKE